MKLNGKEYTLEMTLAGYFAVSALCPGGDMGRIAEITTQTAANGLTAEEVVKNEIALAIALNDAYVNRIEAEHPGRTAPRLSALFEADPDVLKYQSFATFKQLEGELVKAITEGNRAEIEVEPPAEQGNPTAAGQ